MQMATFSKIHLTMFDLFFTNIAAQVIEHGIVCYVATPLASHGMKMTSYLIEQYEDTKKRQEETTREQKRRALQAQLSPSSFDKIQEGIKRYRSYLSPASSDQL